jgi:hypothetical protein
LTAGAAQSGVSGRKREAVCVNKKGYRAPKPTARVPRLALLWLPVAWFSKPAFDVPLILQANQDGDDTGLHIRFSFHDAFLSPSVRQSAGQNAET